MATNAIRHSLRSSQGGMRHVKPSNVLACYRFHGHPDALGFHQPHGLRNTTQRDQNRPTRQRSAVETNALSRKGRRAMGNARADVAGRVTKLIIELLGVKETGRWRVREHPYGWHLRHEYQGVSSLSGDCGLPSRAFRDSPRACPASPRAYAAFPRAFAAVPAQPREQAAR